MAAMRDVQEKHPDVIGDVRGRGAMVAIELVTDPESKTPDADRTAQIVGNALQEGLLLLTAGPLGNNIRVLVPFAVTDDQLEEGLEILARAVDSAAEGSGDKLRPGSE
jgi:4-aminobutyrate aminotransferase/(S)-3-amino-2-methylpropionate transaminase